MADRHLYGNTHRPRLCHLRRRPDFIGYGFNLHCERNKAGQYIGKVDPDSPAEAAGLREDDRIIEVNFVCIEDENHKDVVSRIKEGVMRNNTKYPDEVILLVVDEATDEYYFKNALPISSSDPNVERIGFSEQQGTVEETEDSSKTPSNSEYRNTTDFTGRNVIKKNNTHPSSDKSDSEEEGADYLEVNPPPAYSKNTSESNQPATPPNIYANQVTNHSNRSFAPITLSTRPNNSGPGDTSGLNMTAAEYREQLNAKRGQKRDPRTNSQMPMRDKFDFFNRL